MHWTDTAIVLSARKHGENSAVVRVFARRHGVFAGVVKGATSKANRGVIQPGNIVSATWQARLSEHLGLFKCELLEANAALIMQDAARLTALSSACAVVESALPERHPYLRLYGIFQSFLATLREDGNWPEAYVMLELDVLAEAGFGLDLSQCAATGATEDLMYVSPKSGRAVSRDAGEPYKEKLLALPEFLLSPLPHSGGGLGRGPSLTEKARDLRKNLTDAERQLWYHLRAHRFQNYGFRRQYPIEERYIADFVCLEKMLVIELDGGQHSEQIAYDTARTQFLEQQGYKVLRFWNNEVFENTEGVLTSILSALESKTPSLTLPREEAGEGTHRANGKEEVLAGLRLTGYFLEHWLLAPHNRKLPAARGRLIEMMKDSNTLKEWHGAEA